MSISGEEVRRGWWCWLRRPKWRLPPSRLLLQPAFSSSSQPAQRRGQTRVSKSTSQYFGMAGAPIKLATTCIATCKTCPELYWSSIWWCWTASEDCLVWLTIKKLGTRRRFSLFWTCGFRPECLFSSSLAIFNKSLKVSEKFQSKSRRTGSINEIQSSSSTPVWSDTQWLILIESSIGCCEIIIR